MILQIIAKVKEIIVLFCDLDLQVVAFWEISAKNVILGQETMVCFAESIFTLSIDMKKILKRFTWYEGYE